MTIALIVPSNSQGTGSCEIHDIVIFSLVRIPVPVKSGDLWLLLSINMRVFWVLIEVLQ